MNAQLPKNEGERLRMLELCQLLDTDSEKAFDDLTRLAAAICNTPIGLISLVDEKRQWFKSRVGLDASETPRDYAFCAHAILDSELLVVEDASTDDRFADNPLVLGDPLIRFYAGAPLQIADDIRLGTLCVIDREPKQLAPHQLDALATLRDAVVTQLELRRARKELRAIQSCLSMCAWCHSVKVEEDGELLWRDLEEYVMDALPVSHGICPRCSSSIT